MRARSVGEQENNISNACKPPRPPPPPQNRLSAGSITPPASSSYAKDLSEMTIIETKRIHWSRNHLPCRDRGSCRTSRRGDAALACQYPYPRGHDVVATTQAILMYLACTYDHGSILYRYLNGLQDTVLFQHIFSYTESARFPCECCCASSCYDRKSSQYDNASAHHVRSLLFCTKRMKHYYWVHTKNPDSTPSGGCGRRFQDHRINENGPMEDTFIKETPEGVQPTNQQDTLDSIDENDTNEEGLEYIPHRIFYQLEGDDRVLFATDNVEAWRYGGYMTSTCGCSNASPLSGMDVTWYLVLTKKKGFECPVFRFRWDDFGAITTRFTSIRLDHGQTCIQFEKVQYKVNDEDGDTYRYHEGITLTFATKKIACLVMKLVKAHIREAYKNRQIQRIRNV